MRILHKDKIEESTVPSSLHATTFSFLGIPSQKYAYLDPAAQGKWRGDCVYTGNVSETLSFDLLLKVHSFDFFLRASDRCN